MIKKAMMQQMTLVRRGDKPDAKPIATPAKEE